MVRGYNDAPYCFLAIASLSGLGIEITETALEELCICFYLWPVGFVYRPGARCVACVGLPGQVFSSRLNHDSVK